MSTYKQKRNLQRSASAPEIGNSNSNCNDDHHEKVNSFILKNDLAINAQKKLEELEEKQNHIKTIINVEVKDNNFEEEEKKLISDLELDKFNKNESNELSNESIDLCIK